VRDKREELDDIPRDDTTHGNWSSQKPVAMFMDCMAQTASALQE
jgi:hypothetical protein